MRATAPGFGTAVLRERAQDLHSPPVTVAELLEMLAKVAPTFAAQAGIDTIMDPGKSRAFTRPGSSSTAPPSPTCRAGGCNSTGYRSVRPVP